MSFSEGDTPHHPHPHPPQVSTLKKCILLFHVSITSINRHHSRSDTRCLYKITKAGTCSALCLVILQAQHKANTFCCIEILLWPFYHVNFLVEALFFCARVKKKKPYPTPPILRKKPRIHTQTHTCPQSTRPQWVPLLTTIHCSQIMPPSTCHDHT